MVNSDGKERLLVEDKILGTRRDSASPAASSPDRGRSPTSPWSTWRDARAASTPTRGS